MSDDSAANRYSALSDDELKRIAAAPPSDSRERGALATEMQRRAATLRASSDPAGPSKVVVTDIDMPFGSMVSFMVKWAIASVPALFILLVIGLIVAVFLAAVGIRL